ncbi:MAG: PD40 domain-containing protein [Saprospiraceae bacterium]|nr:PD40 domain-containing protein [Saprospiraceae bacterium]
MKIIFKHIALILLGLYFASGSLTGQNLIKKGNNLYSKQNYCEALYYYNQYLAVHASKDIYFKRGVCHYHCRDLDMAIEDIENSITLGNLDKETNLFLAKSYQDKQEFEKAINYYKLYLNDIFKNEAEKATVLDIIKKCSNGVYHKFRSTDHFIENWGKELNTLYNDIMPVQSQINSSVFYFGSDKIKISDSDKKFREYRSEFSNGSWKTTAELFLLNPAHNLLILDFNMNEMELLFYLGYQLKNGTIYSGKFLNNEIEYDSKIKFKGPIMSELSFSYATYINDSTLVFSSNMQGGYGGNDIYITGIRNGLWIKPVNLGPAINTKFDEISPYISSDGEMIFFSSNNTGSIGGFDIFTSVYDFHNDVWSEARNMGIPLNSTRDEINFRVLSSGLGAIYSSDRKDMGFGGFDNYWMYFKNGITTSNTYAQELPFLANRKLDFIDVFPAHKPLETEVKAPEIVVNEVKIEPENESKDNIVDIPVPESVQIKSETETKDVFTFAIPMICLKDDEFTENSVTVKVMDQLAGLMMKNKDLEVEFVGNAYTWNTDKNDMVRSVKMAMRLADSLQLRMINKSRIHVKGSGSNFPYAKLNGPDRSKNIILKVNNRVDIYLHNIDDEKIIVKKDEFYLNRTLLDTRHTLYETIIEGLTYRVQLKSGNFLVTEETQAEFNDAGIEYDPQTSVYTYTVGIYKEYRQAKELFEKLLSNYRTNIKILPYINGLRLENNEILSYAKKYNDLVNFLADNK